VLDPVRGRIMRAATHLQVARQFLDTTLGAESPRRSLGLLGRLLEPVDGYRCTVTEVDPGHS
jgi:hypothetical protein